VRYGFYLPTRDGCASGTERRPFSGTVQQVADDIGAYEKVGVSELVFDFRSEHLAETLEGMERFAQTIR
jgi:hypothetical protein